ncbi:hypothetical protein [Litorisediminicola beolgyonensis]|uniref:Uncharacterized protein n=1 Tax=Litorisediminicola beolgyonensis TaxID=1173614 RepID=A0ABW3ZJL4_9RHOB
MKSMALGFIAIAVIATGAWFALETFWDTTAEERVSNSVRLGEAGSADGGEPLETEATQ